MARRVDRLHGVMQGALRFTHGGGEVNRPSWIALHTCAEARSTENDPTARRPEPMKSSVKHAEICNLGACGISIAYQYSIMVRSPTLIGRARAAPAYRATVTR